MFAWFCFKGSTFIQIQLVVSWRIELVIESFLNPDTLRWIEDIPKRKQTKKKLMNKYFEWVEILLYYGIPYVSDRLSPELSFLRKWCALGNSNYFKAANLLEQLLQKSTSKWYWSQNDPANKSANCPKCEFFLQHDTLTDYPIILREIKKMISGSLFKAYNKLKETHFI